MHCLSRLSREVVFVTFVAQPEIKKADILPLASLFYHFRKKAQTRRVLLQSAVEGGLIPKPSPGELEAIIPCDGQVPNHQFGQNQPS